MKSKHKLSKRTEPQRGEVRFKQWLAGNLLFYIYQQLDCIVQSSSLVYLDIFKISRIAIGNFTLIAIT